MKTCRAIATVISVMLLTLSSSARAQLVPEWTAHHIATTGFLNLGVTVMGDQSATYT